ncbi:MAG: hypothetical protein HY207_06880 [Nitrospirae bacterium]|nr:hypothetical protein [Nitrospirota bacterium]
MVRPMIEAALASLPDVRVLLYAPHREEKEDGFIFSDRDMGGSAQIDARCEERGVR